MPRWRSTAEFLLARRPALYDALLRLRPGHDLDKRVFLRLVREGDVVFDVGANLGLYTLLFSHRTGRTGQVHAFEPAPPTFQALLCNLDREGRFRNVVANGVAVGAAAGTASLYLPGDDHGQASLTGRPGAPGRESRGSPSSRSRSPRSTPTTRRGAAAAPSTSSSATSRGAS